MNSTHLLHFNFNAKHFQFCIRFCAYHINIYKRVWKSLSLKLINCISKMFLSKEYFTHHFVKNN